VPPIPLTYCTNVHPGESAAEVLAVLGGPVARVAAAVGEGRPFPVGAWWSERFVAEARACSAVRDALRARLIESRLAIASVNVFPMAGFHAEGLKTAVYSPGWEREERLRYSCDAADLLAELLPAGGSGSLSTVPLGFAPRGTSSDLRRMARNLIRAASHLRALKERTGRSLVLALEPEPGCLLETVRGAVEFLQDRVFGDGALDVPQDILREHLGLCVDLCHLAVVGEDPVAALDSCRAAGVRIGKIQVSCALEARLVRGPEAALQALLRFAEPRYLHQSAGWLPGKSHPALRALDLDEVARARAEWLRCTHIRTHFHVPVFWDTDGVLGSTRAALQPVLCWPALGETVPLLEVETYTWGVLPADLAPADLVDGIVAELRSVQSLRAGR
jgi:sugar phosphate isomerase/epimerase